MKTKILFILFIFVILSSCNETNQNISSIHPENWTKRAIKINSTDSLISGKTYLSVYSQIYSQSEHKTHNLTAMVSLRNTSTKDTIYLLKAEYFDTRGTSVRTYFNQTIYLKPLETTEIIIDEKDISGGTGSNFIFDWKIPKDCPEPLFEGIMNSTMGQQGLSFVTKGHRIE
ncbi:MAG: DUF3124 domain-containing protein [Psychroserpens sp.]|nr:DUF3124 domain-containing protein [Psychroserpens sp.]